MPLHIRPQAPVSRITDLLRNIFLWFVVLAAVRAAVTIEQTMADTEEATRTSTLDASDPASISVTDQLQQTLSSEETVAETVRQHQPRSSDASSSSWWGYVGWGTALPTSSASGSQDGGEGGGAVTEADSEISTPTVKPTPDAETPAPGTPVSEPLTSKEANPEPIVQAEEPKTVRAPSVLSAQTQASAWYYPWAWYGDTSLSSLSASAEASASAGTGATDGMTAAEVVKEEALARDAQTEPTPSLAEATPAVVASPAPSEPVNPIESTITSYSSGWASFFSSRKLLVKSITNGPEVQRDENGMEIMDIEDDTDTASKIDVAKVQGNAGGASSTTSLPLKGKGQPSEPLQPDKQQQPPPSPNKSQSTSDKQPAAPPLTISDSVKQSVKANNKRKGPPPPVQKSGTSTPPPPPGGRTPPPNLVLPTWQDTFHTPPRSIVPPPPSTKFSKTMKFVSGVLFPKDAHDTLSTTRRGKEMERRDREMLQFGKELPRAWDVIGDKIQPDVLKGCQRVVVIGIHGWFPGTYDSSRISTHLTVLTI